MIPDGKHGQYHYTIYHNIMQSTRLKGVLLVMTATAQEEDDSNPMPQ